MTEKNQTNFESQALEALKTKDPIKYKSMCIAGIAYTNEESQVLPFIEQTERYIKESLDRPEGEKLKFEIPKECSDLDTLISVLAKDVKDGVAGGDITTLRMKSIVGKGINLLKDFTVKFDGSNSFEDNEELLENCVGTFDLVMSVQGIAKMMDENTKDL